MHISWQFHISRITALCLLTFGEMVLTSEVYENIILLNGQLNNLMGGQIIGKRH